MSLASILRPDSLWTRTLLIRPSLQISARHTRQMPTFLRPALMTRTYCTSVGCVPVKQIKTERKFGRLSIPLTLQQIRGPESLTRKLVTITRPSVVGLVTTSPRSAVTRIDSRTHQPTRSSPSSSATLSSPTSSSSVTTLPLVSALVLVMPWASRSPILSATMSS